MTRLLILSSITFLVTCTLDNNKLTNNKQSINLILTDSIKEEIRLTAML